MEEINYNFVALLLFINFISGSILAYVLYINPVDYFINRLRKKETRR